MDVKLLIRPIALYAAGVAQVQTPQNTNFADWGTPLDLNSLVRMSGNGDDPRDQLWIRAGIEYYQWKTEP